MIHNLPKADFVSRGGKRIHRNCEHPAGYRLLVPIQRGEAKPCQQRDIEEAIKAVSKPTKAP